MWSFPYIIFSLPMLKFAMHATHFLPLRPFPYATFQMTKITFILFSEASKYPTKKLSSKSLLSILNSIPYVTIWSQELVVVPPPGLVIIRLEFCVDLWNIWFKPWCSLFSFSFCVHSKSGVLGFGLTVIQSKCDIIGEPKLLTHNETPLVERTTPTIPDEDHVHSLLIEDIDDSPPTSIQNPSTSTQNCSAHSPTQNKKRKLQSTDDAISVLGKGVSDVMKMMVQVTTDVRLLYEKFDTLKEDVSRMMMGKDKEVNVGFKKLETLQEDVSKLIENDDEKSKEDDMGACIKKLDKLGWGAQEPIYDTALLLFGQSADYRKLWLHLKPESCGKWVKNAGSMFGLLD